jgi:hypothetical protein
MEPTEQLDPPNRRLPEGRVRPLLNADQHFGHLVFPCKSKRFNHFLDRPLWLLLVLKALFWRITQTFSGTLDASLGAQPRFSKPTISGSNDLSGTLKER